MTVTQPLGASVFVFLGFCFGVFFDFYRIVRRVSTPGRFLTAITDLFFWFAYTAWVYIALLKLNLGEVRFFLLLCLVIGAGIYFTWLSKDLVQAGYLVLCRALLVAAWIGTQANKVFNFVVRILLWPYRLVVAYLITPIVAVYGWLFAPLVKVHAGGRKLSHNLASRLKSIFAHASKIIAELWTGPLIDE